MKKNLAFGGKRGQAAIEFLTTYGWAILVIVLVLAALVWMGVFNTKSATSDRCAFDPTLQCSSMRLRTSTTTGKVFLLEMTITPRTNQAFRLCGIESRTGDTPQHVPLITDCSASTPPWVESGNSVRLGFPGPFTFNGASPTPPMLYTLIDYGLIFDMFAMMDGMIFKEGNTNVALTSYTPGEQFSGNVFIYYYLEGDKGTARTWRGEVFGTLQ